MSNHSPAAGDGTGNKDSTGTKETTVLPPAADTLDPDHEYQDSTESKLDHTRPPHHEGAVKNVPHQDAPQISIGDS